MSARDLFLLLILSAIWGSSFLFVRIVAPVLGPVWLIAIRVALAGVALLLYVWAIRQAPEFRQHWRHFAVIGMLNSAIPFVLIAWAELNITASLAATVNAATPLFAALVGVLWLGDQMTHTRALGLLLGMVGVAVLVGLGPLPLTPIVLLSVGASLVATFCYGLAGNYSKKYMQGIPALATTTYSQMLGAIPLLLLVPFTAPQNLSAKLEGVGLPLVIGSSVTLALLCTGVAYLIYFGLIQRIGPIKVSMVTFLAPVFGTLWGILFLHEQLTWGSVLGFSIVLSSVSLVSGLTLGSFSAPRAKVG
jgi:drug/metabolite transporter (DMT)-like permease